VENKSLFLLIKFKAVTTIIAQEQESASDNQKKLIYGIRLMLHQRKARFLL
jgi:hypothetical protein